MSKERLAIELDGGQHLEIENVEYDSKRTDYLNNKNVKVIRFFNGEVYNNIDLVLEKIRMEFITTP